MTLLICLSMCEICYFHSLKDRVKLYMVSTLNPKTVYGGDSVFEEDLSEEPYPRESNNAGSNEKKTNKQ